MAEPTDAVREALGDISYNAIGVPELDTPQDDDPNVSVLITDPVHCTGRHVHHDFQAVVASAMCGLVGRVPEGTFTGTFTHHPTPAGRSADVERKDDWIYKETITEEHKQSAIFLAMAGWMVLVNVVDELKGNYVYIEKRWKAAITGLSLTDKVCNVSRRK